MAGSEEQMESANGAGSEGVAGGTEIARPPAPAPQASYPLDFARSPGVVGWGEYSGCLALGSQQALPGLRTLGFSGAGQNVDLEFEAVAPLQDNLPQ